MKRACSTCGRVDCTEHKPWTAGSTRQWRKLRAKVLERDHGICQIRGPLCTVVAEHVDHVVSKTRGGRDTMENLVASCGPCNLSKGG